jgi:hypothetical protein
MGDSYPNGQAKIVAPTYRPLVRIRDKRAVHVKVVGPVHSWFMHWDDVDQRTIPCILSECRGCATFASRRPLSYLPVAHHVTRPDGRVWVPSIMEVPLTAGLQLIELRGAFVALSRSRARGPINIVSFSTQDPPPAFGAFDIVPSLMRLWRLPPSAQLRMLPSDEASMWNVSND